jgi:hypothetical protein
MMHLRFLFVLVAVGGGLSVACAQPPAAAPPAQPAAGPPVKAAPPPAVAAKPGPPSADCPPCDGAECCVTHPLDGRIFVFVANGAGAGSMFGDTLRDVAQEMRAPLVVRTILWARAGSVRADQRDQEAHQKGATRMAMQAQCVKMKCPHSPIVFVGYSAGTQVATSAAEQMPPGWVDRVVLLGSSMSACYDLRTALRASCGGIDSFYSGSDGVLSMAESEFGTTDGRIGPMGGRVGFRDPSGGGGDYCNVRQYRWREGMGGYGDHFAWATREFQAKHLVPLLSIAGCAVDCGPSCGPTCGSAPPPPPAPGGEPPLGPPHKK